MTRNSNILLLTGIFQTHPTIFPMNFCIQKGYSGREALAIRASAGSLGCGFVHSDVALEGMIPIGSVEFCLPVFGLHERLFIPDFLSSMMNRGWGTLLGTDRLDEASFVKDLTEWKSDWKSGVYPAGAVIPDGFWLVSEPVSFIQEWRYYVAGGEVLTTGWYMGEDEDEPAPLINVAWPSDFSGAVDFGRLPDGRMALVEAHAPFACGWYGEGLKDYALWMAAAWDCREWWIR